VAKLDPSGNELWAGGYGDGAEDQFAEDVAVDGAGNVVVTGRFKSSIDFGGGALTSAADRYDVFVAKLDPNGAELWSSGHGDGAQDQFAGGVAVDGSGNVLLAGRFRSSIDFGGGALSSVSDKHDIYVVKLDPNGAHQWSHSFGDGTQNQYAESITVDSAAEVVVTGRLRGSVDFGGGALTSVGGKYDVYYAKLDAAGQHVCSQSFGDGTQDQFGEAVAVDSSDNMLLTGRFRGSIDFGGGAMSSAGGKRDVFAARFSP
jgi:outer membrane protein assembly factor BamB